MIIVAPRWSHYLQMLSEVCTHICLMVKLKDYLQEKGSLAIDPEGSQDPTHSEE
jgi:hypothetical protein